MPIGVTHLSLCDDATIEQLRCALEHWRQINDGHHSEKRRVLRRRYSGQPFVALRASEEEVVAFYTWSRDVSEQGVCLLMPREIAPALNDGRSERINLWKLLAIGTELAIALPCGDDNDVWLRGAVRRVRSFSNVAVECGVEFVDRAQRRT